MVRGTGREIGYLIGLFEAGRGAVDDYPTSNYERISSSSLQGCIYGIQVASPLSFFLGGGDVGGDVAPFR